jgi:hypothetical protein
MQAQSVTLDTAAVADSATASQAPTLANASVGVRAPGTANTVQLATGATAPVWQARSSNRNATTLMIVGAAALLVGAIVGDDPGTIIMVGGAAIGLYGLWLFLQ